MPVSLIFYYRIFPDYLVAYQSSLIFTKPFVKWLSINLASLLTKLHPYTTELLWLPIHNHARILAGTFRENSALGLYTFQKMQAISLPGFQLTLKKALSAIVADRFANVNTTAELITSVTLTHPLLPLLIPAFYQLDENERSLAPPRSGNSEIDILFPIFQKSAKDTLIALKINKTSRSVTRTWIKTPSSQTVATCDRTLERDPRTRNCRTTENISRRTPQSFPIW
jgi:hypothetical protein